MLPHTVNTIFLLYAFQTETSCLSQPWTIGFNSSSVAQDVQQVRQAPPQYRSGRQRPYGLAELRRKREEAVARETDYNRDLIARNDKRRQARFRLHKQHAIFRLYQWLLPRGT